MIELVSELKRELIMEPFDRHLDQAFQTCLIQLIALNDRNEGTHFAFKVNYQRQGHGHDELQHEDVLELQVRVVLLFLVQVPDKVVNENVQKLGHSDNQHFISKISTYEEGLNERDRLDIKHKAFPRFAWEG